MVDRFGRPGGYVFADRRAAGRALAERLAQAPAVKAGNLVVLGLPRGGVVVAAEVARELSAPLDILVVRKLGVPYQPELAMGAIGEEGARVLNGRVLDATGVDDRDIEAVERVERTELERRAGLYRGNRAPLSLVGRTALIVDDGIATGATAAAACHIARARGAGRVIVATPVAPAGAVELLTDVADEVIALQTPAEFFAIGDWYRNFAPTSDEEVSYILAGSQPPR